MTLLVVFLAGLCLGAVLGWIRGLEAGRREGRVEAWTGPRTPGGPGASTPAGAAVRFRTAPYDWQRELEDLGRQMVKRL